MKVAIDVKSTPWANGIAESYVAAQESIPEIVETQFKLWQRRVDMEKPVQWQPHATLFTITCQRYAKRADDVFAPVEPPEVLAFWVAADSSRDAVNRVDRELTAHGYNPSDWCKHYGGPSPMILV